MARIRLEHLLLFIELLVILTERMKTILALLFIKPTTVQYPSHIFYAVLYGQLRDNLNRLHAQPFKDVLTSLLAVYGQVRYFNIMGQVMLIVSVRLLLQYLDIMGKSLTVVLVVVYEADLLTCTL